MGTLKNQQYKLRGKKKKKKTHYQGHQAALPHRQTDHGARRSIGGEAWDP